MSGAVAQGVYVLCTAGSQLNKQQASDEQVCWPLVGLLSKVLAMLFVIVDAKVQDATA